MNSLASAVSLALICNLVTGQTLEVLLGARRMEDLLGSETELIRSGGVSGKDFLT